MQNECLTIFVKVAAINRAFGNTWFSTTIISHLGAGNFSHFSQAGVEPSACAKGSL